MFILFVEIYVDVLIILHRSIEDHMFFLIWVQIFHISSNIHHFQFGKLAALHNTLIGSPRLPSPSLPPQAVYPLSTRAVRVLEVPLVLSLASVGPVPACMNLRLGDG